MPFEAKTVGIGQQGSIENHREVRTGKKKKNDEALLTFLFKASGTLVMYLWELVGAAVG